MSEKYKIVYRPGQGEIVEKKSRFIAHVQPVGSEEEALEFIGKIKKKYWDARHNCYAYTAGANREVTRCSDDGEPSGTAGKPILEVLLGADVTNVAAVVTRYFGGTLLGTGGLVRAYTQAAREAIENAGIGIMRYKTEMTIEIDYTDVGKVQYLLGSRKINIAQSRYAEKVEFDIRIPEEERTEISSALTEATAARAKMNIIGTGYDMDIA